MGWTRKKRLSGKNGKRESIIKCESRHNSIDCLIMDSTSCNNYAQSIDSPVLCNLVCEERGAK